MTAVTVKEERVEGVQEQNSDKVGNLREMWLTITNNAEPPNVLFWEIYAKDIKYRVKDNGTIVMEINPASKEQQDERSAEECQRAQEQARAAAIEQQKMQAAKLGDVHVQQKHQNVGGHLSIPNNNNKKMTPEEEASRRLSDGYGQSNAIKPEVSTTGRFSPNASSTRESEEPSRTTSKTAAIPLQPGEQVCTLAFCDNKGQGFVKEKDHHGEPGFRCHTHGGKVKCNIPDCDGNFQGRTTEDDEMGPAGPRCGRHGGVKRCQIPDCQRMHKGYVRDKDHHGEPGRRCNSHGGVPESQKSGTAEIKTRTRKAK